MRIWFLALVVATATDVSAQRNREPFVDGIEIGLGYGTVVDFNADNNGFYIGALLERLQYQFISLRWIVYRQKEIKNETAYRSGNNICG